MGRLTRRKKLNPAEHTFSAARSTLECDWVVAQVLGIPVADLRSWVLIARVTLQDGQVQTKVLPSRFGDFAWARRFLEAALDMLRRHGV